jgi:hypothetical protein
MVIMLPIYFNNVKRTLHMRGYEETQYKGMPDIKTE